MRDALRDIVTSPSAWVVAAAGFMARGGVLVFALPVLSLPTPVGVTLLIPPLSVTTSGISSVFVPELVAVGAVLLGIVVVALVLAALVDATSYGLIAHVRRPAPAGDAPAEPPDGPPGDARVGPLAPLPGVSAGLVGRLVAVELLALVPALIAGFVTASRLIAVGEQEFLLPTSIDVPYAVRVLRGASDSVIALGACLLVADLANALISRRVLRRSAARGVAGRVAAAASGQGHAALPGAGAVSGARVATRTHGRARRDTDALVRIAATWVAAWFVTLVSIVPGLVAIELAWPGVRDTYTATLSRTPPAPDALVAATLVFVAAWVAAVLIAGLGSAIRTILWSFATVP